MDDEPGKREYENEMEYEMKGGFLRVIATSSKRRG